MKQADNLIQLVSVFDRAGFRSFPLLRKISHHDCGIGEQFYRNLIACSLMLVYIVGMS